MPAVSSNTLVKFCNEKFDAYVDGNQQDFIINRIYTEKTLAEGGIAFINKFEDNREKLNVPRKSIIISPRNAHINKNSEGLLISVDNPRLAFAVILSEFFVSKEPFGVHHTAQIHHSAIIDPTASIGEYCVIGSDCIVGPGTILHRHVVLSKNVRIGRNCVIWSHAVIGEDGFGIEKDSFGNSLRIPHIGGVVLGDGVHIGNGTAIAAGTIEPTVIGDYTMIDNLVHIAHNVKIGSNCNIVACSEVSGSVCIGDHVWIAPNAAIIQKIDIGTGSTIGLGAAVLRSVQPYSVVAGVPARNLNK